MPITIERTADYGLIRSILTHPQIYPHISDDFSPAREEFQPPPDHPSIWYLAARDGEEVLGIWMLVWHSPVLVECHTCLLPVAWGRRAAIAAREALRWVFANSEAQTLMTNVPAYNRLALRFAKQSGMTEFGRIPSSFRKNQKDHDQIVMGLSREQICQQQ